MNLVAIDPGLATGVAYAHWDGERLSAAPFAIELTYEAALDWCWANIAPRMTVVCEGFTIGPETIRKSAGENWSLESVGALRWMARHRGAAFETPMPAQKRFAPDSALRAVGWWDISTSGHARDALRHLLAWAAKAGDRGLRTALAQPR